MIEFEDMQQDRIDGTELCELYHEYGEEKWESFCAYLNFREFVLMLRGLLDGGHNDRI